jgi:branched-chain amino acid transport system permease protein
MQLFGRVLIDTEILRQLLYGLAMVAIMLARPAGLWPSPRSEDRPEAAHPHEPSATGEVQA